MADSPFPSRCDVVVIGAGLAGLAAAIHLQQAGAEVVLLESEAEPGGRIRTDVVDGFRLDRGFQLYNPAYPEGRRMFDHAALDLKGFERGAVVAIGASHRRIGDPRSHPTWIPDALRAGVGGPIGIAAFGVYAARCAAETPQRLAARPDESLITALTEAHVSPQLIERVLRPFLAGVFLEPDLATSRRFADFILRSFLRGTPAIPATGMAALPRQLAGKVDSLHCGVRVTDAASGNRVVTDHGEIATRAVVVAVGPGQVSSLLPGFPAPRTNSCTTWYHRPDCPPDQLHGGLAILSLDGDGPSAGPLVNTCVLTAAAPSYSPPGTSLVASTALGADGGVTEAQVRRHLARLYGVDTGGWDLIATYPIADALPSMVPPLTLRQPVVLGDGRYVAGDHRDTASIQGALVSGRRAADAVAADLGLRRRPPTAA